MDKTVEDQAPDSPPKKKIVCEEIKDRHTSHWDLDMLTREELERLHKQYPKPGVRSFIDALSCI